MKQTNRLIPRKPVPDLEVTTTGGSTWRLADRSPQHLLLVLFYRGLHCPICRLQLREWDAKLEELAKRGVDAIAVSTDTRERALRTPEEWGLKNVTLGYGLSIETARAWGLYVSRAIKDSEPPEFSEPGLFLIKPDKTLFAAQVSTMPFARPPFADIVRAIDFVIQNNYPARGEA
jgi:peroxiredoxin